MFTMILINHMTKVKKNEQEQKRTPVKMTGVSHLFKPLVWFVRGARAPLLCSIAYGVEVPLNLHSM